MKMCCLALFISKIVLQIPATCLGQPANSHRPFRRQSLEKAAQGFEVNWHLMG